MSTHKTYQATVIEWLSHTATIRAVSLSEAEEKARRLWDDKETEAFSFKDSGVDGITVEEVQP